jgi:hypothetical protein
VIEVIRFAEEAVQRAGSKDFGDGIVLRICSCEDLIVMKAFADRERDWLDIDGILARQSTSLDRGYVRSKLGPLVALKEAPEILGKLEARFQARAGCR